MLGIFTNGDEVIICEVDQGTPDTGDWFAKNTGRNKDDFDYQLVDGPICITHGSLQHEAERTH